MIEQKFRRILLVALSLCISSSLAFASDVYVVIDNSNMFKDSGKVYHSSYLLEHRDVLEMISGACKSGIETNMSRCEQADIAQLRIRSSEQSRVLRLKMGVK